MIDKSEIPGIHANKLTRENREDQHTGGRQKKAKLSMGK